MKYFWVIGGGVLQLPFVKEAQRAGYRVIVTDGDYKCLCKAFADIFRHADIFDIPEHFRIARELKKIGIVIDGVIAASIDASVTNSSLNEYLGLKERGASVDAATITHNKHLFRQKMQDLGYSVPQWVVISGNKVKTSRWGSGERKLYISTCSNMLLNGPVIIKNTDNSAGRGNTVFHSLPTVDTLEEAVDKAIAASSCRKAIMETMWTGCECTVETLFDYKGKFWPCFITDRKFIPAENGGNSIEQGLRHPSTIPEDMQKKMFQLARKVAKDIGITHGAAKFDMIITDKGPRIIEMATRLSGGFDCTHLVPAATGKNVVRAAILTALGKPFTKDILEDNKGWVAISQSMWLEPGRRIEEISDLKARSIQGVNHIIWRYKKGDIIDKYEDCSKRVNFIITSGETEEEAVMAGITAKSFIKVRLSKTTKKRKKRAA